MKTDGISLVIKSLVIIIGGIFIVFLPVFAQNQISKKTEQSFVSDKHDLREKVFLHIDRKMYFSGEMIRFKGYCVHQTFNLPVDLSKVLYVEILNNQNQSILAEKVSLSGGTGCGYVYIPRSLQTGIYYMRAYTRWMTNFDPEHFFTEKIFIVNPFLPLEIIQDSANMHIDYTVEIYPAGNKLENARKNEIAFLATDQNGNGLNIRGWVVGNSDDTVTSFNTWEYGFGLFSFTPETGQEYKMITESPDGGKQEIPLSLNRADSPGNNYSGKNFKTNHGNRFDIKVQRNKDLYTAREKVILTLQTTDQTGKPVESNMSLSVYKYNEQLNIYHKNIYQYLNHTACLPASLLPPDDKVPFSAYDSEELNSILDIIYSAMCTMNHGKTYYPDDTYTMPETRGITISGTIYNNKNGKPASGVGIYLARPANYTQLYKSRSGPNGGFNLQMYDQYGRNDIILMPAENPENYTLVLDEDFSGKQCNFHPAYFWPDEQTIRYIEKLMVNVQIADAFQKNQESLNNSSSYELANVFGNPDETVLLADYIRLPAVEELFYELVKSVRIKRRKNNFILMITENASQLAMPGEPLLLLDGVPVLDVTPVITYMDPIDIDRIEVVSEWYVQGREFYYSIINMITKQSDYGHFDLPSYAIRAPFQFLQYPVPFHSPDYSRENDTIRTIPDFRNLLYWNPEVVTDTNGIATVSFYTSDDISDYRVVIQGITEKGLSGYMETGIKVTETEE